MDDADADAYDEGEGGEDEGEGTCKKNGTISRE
jgi:hypothetical protein